MKRVVWVLLAVLCLCGCGERKAASLYETAQFEEKQFNRDHAGKLYQEIIDKYPDSPYAAKARERLEALSSQ